MDSLDYWRLCNELTIIQAALLIVDYDPSTAGQYIEQWDFEKRPDGYEAAKSAISKALLRGHIEGKVIPIFDREMNTEFMHAIADSVDVERSWVFVDSLREWLSARGFKTGFFFPDGGTEPDYLDQSNPRYAPKLAAAVRAWLATADEALLRGKSPKHVLKKWLREHAAEFGLVDDEGKPNETGIEEVAKVANWRLQGGAPKTPF